MSGQNSIKGYLFQSLIAVFSSFNKDWEEICVEPDTENDKIDIIWFGEKLEICQVKSSINNFTKGDILKWIENLRLENHSADKYSISLIGNSNASTKTFFNTISTKSKSEFVNNESLFKIKEKIEVIFNPNNIDTLESALISEVDKFLFSKGISANYPSKQLISAGMINQIIKISTSGKKMTRLEFEKNILDWVTYNYSTQIKFTIPQFKLEFYLNNVVDYSTTISRIQIIELQKIELYKSRLKLLENKFNIISNYDFEIKSFEVHSNDTIRMSYFQDIRDGYIDKQVIIDDWNINFLSKLCSKILGLKPEKEFFNFGQLKETKTKDFGAFHHGKKTLSGTKDEKEKYKIFEEFKWELRELEDLIKFWKKLSKLSPLPLILTNNGSQYEQNIKVQLHFPKNVKIYKAKNFPVPNDIDILKDLNNDNFFFDILRQKKTSKIKEYYSSYPMPQFISLSSYFGNGKFDEQSKFKRFLRYYFDFEYYDENETNIIECEFDNLNTNEKVGFPAFIFIISNKDFEINYYVSCKNYSEKITGKLIYKVSC